MSRFVFDIETDGLLDTVSKIHCIVLHDLDTGAVITCRSDNYMSIPFALMTLQSAEEIIGHNIMNYDLPVLEKLYGFKTNATITDTLVLSRLVHPDTKDLDFKKGLPRKLIGSHSLDAWGHRLGFHKGDYAKEMKAKGLDPWAELNDDMVAYCENDVALNVKLYELLMSKGFSQRSIDLEHAVWKILLEQMSFGCAFNEKAAWELTASLRDAVFDIEKILKKEFGSWEIPQGFYSRANGPRGIKAGDPKPPKVIEFNAGSRDHIAKVLQERGWKPTKFTNTGKPVVDESVLEEINMPEAKMLTEYLLLAKRVGQIADGKNAWLKLSKKGRIYGRINANGAVTGRATHSSPNLAQVPRVGSPYGEECRSLFMASPGWTFVGADASGLELRCLAHFLAKWDGGEYGKIILEGDIHTANQQAAGLPTRNDAKTFIYALLYGAGDAKIGSIVGKGPKAGKQLKAKFMKALPAFGSLYGAVQGACDKGFLTGLDGRKMHVRSKHSALNTLLQGAGAVIMKQAMVNFHDLMAIRGYHHGNDYRQVLWIHDEFQCECKPELSHVVGSTMVEAIRKVTSDFNLRCPLDGEFKVGANWAMTH